MTHGEGGPSAPLRRTWRAIAGLAVLVGLMVVAAACPWSSDLQAGLPQDDPALGRLLAFFRERGSVRLMAVEAWASAPGADPAAVLRSLSVRLADAGAHPVPLADPNGVARAATLVEAHLPELLPPERLIHLGEDVAEEALLARLRRLRARLSVPEDAFSAAVAQRDVLGLVGAPMALLASLGGGTQIEGGVVRHADGMHALLPMEVSFPPEDTARSIALMVAIEAARQEAGAAGVVLEPIGAYRHFADNASQLMGDLLWSVPAGCVAIAVILGLVARTWAGFLVMHLPALAALAGAAATATLLGRPVPLPLLGFAACLVGIAIDYGIQSVRALQDGSPHRLRRPLARSALIAVAAFAALIPSPVPALSSLGWMLASGIACAWATARYLVPALVRPRPLPDPWTARIRPLLSTCESHPRLALGVAILITVLAMPGLRWLTVINDPLRLDGSRPETQAALRSFLERWGSLEPSTFVVARAATEDGALAAAAAARDRLGIGPGVLEALVPDRASQQRRRMAWNAAWASWGPVLAHRLPAACAAAGLRSAAFEPSLTRYAPCPVDAPVVTAESWHGTPVQRLLDGLIRHNADGSWQVASPVDRRVDPAALAARAAADPELAPAWVASRGDLGPRLVAAFTGDLGRRSVIIGLVVLIAVALITRRLRAAAGLLAPPVLALLWTLGLLGWCGIPLNGFAVLTASLVAGVGIECALFLGAARDRDAILTPSLACIATTLAGTASLLTAGHPVLAGTGLLLTVGVLGSLVACLLTAPLLGCPPGDG